MELCTLCIEFNCIRRGVCTVHIEFLNRMLQFYRCVCIHQVTELYKCKLQAGVKITIKRMTICRVLHADELAIGTGYGVKTITIGIGNCPLIPVPTNYSIPITTILFLLCICTFGILQHKLIGGITILEIDNMRR